MTSVEHKLDKVIDDTIHFLETFDNLNSHPVSNIKIKLNDGIEIPQIGLGMFAYDHVFRFQDKTRQKTYKNEEEKKQKEIEDMKEKIAFKNAVKYGIINGYRHIDGADSYRNSKQIGEALAELINDEIIQRKDIFITTKIAMKVRTANAVRKAVNKSLNEFQTNYIDLYLIHSPHTSLKKDNRGQDVIQVYKTLHELKTEGKIRSIGVSNFNISHIEALEKNNL
eukprot:175906_1